jgi:hypothetical protein
VPIGAESLIRDLEGFEIREGWKRDLLKQLLLLLLSCPTQKMSVEGSLQLILVQADPGTPKFVAILPGEASSLHDTANDGGVKQLLEGSGGDIVSEASGRRVAKLAGKQEEGRPVEPCKLVELVRVEVAEVDLGTRGQRKKLGILRNIGLGVVLITAAVPARRHFFGRKKKFLSSFDEKLAFNWEVESNYCDQVN